MINECSIIRYALTHDITKEEFIRPIDFPSAVGQAIIETIQDMQLKGMFSTMATYIPYVALVKSKVSQKLKKMEKVLPSEFARLIPQTYNCYNAKLKELYVGMIREKQEKMINTLFEEIKNSNAPIVQKVEALTNGVLKIKNYSSTADNLLSMEGAVAQADAHITQTPDGLSTGMEALDDFTGGLKKGEVTVLAARSGVGKSAFALQQAIDIAQKYGNTLFISLEMSARDLAIRAMVSKSKVPLRRITQRKKSPLSEQEKAHLKEAKEHYKKLPLYFLENTIDETTIADAIRSHVRGKNIRAVFVDYLQLISPNDKNAIREQQVAGISKMLKRCAVECDIPIVVIAQLNRNSEKREDKRPELIDLRDSGQIEQDADVVMMLYKEDIPRSDGRYPIEVLIRKGRAIGTGKIQMFFNSDYLRFEEYNEPPY